MSKSTSAGKARTKTRTPRPKSASSGPVAFFICLFIIALGSIQLLSTFHTYALNTAELNGLKKQEASLTARKQDLENDISRWNDKAYVTAQARERLGFVFPGEQSVQVEHPEVVTGGDQLKDKAGSDKRSSSDNQALPWYSELAYAFQKADEPAPSKAQPQKGNQAATGGGQEAPQPAQQPDAGHQQ
ncbi:septum formation initiator family protein [Bifidobacterium aemilianum]|uniref:Septum formation initiator family protein n=1 Tax=Bifidobacterium aemilianum TaxID=2493120 RepID=A0A366K8W8_9BIFI|nr:septum formation initiator family protein [Bifidobacterium aemilianum]RBP98114.1 septum formation initiator family protein [Bifidobacterium aemilianum]